MDRSVPSGAGRVSGAGELCATVCWCSCRRSMVTAANKIKTAAAARPKPNDHQLYGRFCETPPLPVGDLAHGACPTIFESIPLPARKAPATAVLVAAFSVPFQARKNRSLRLQSFLQIGQGIPVPRGCCVLRNSQRAGDLAECKIVPDFQDQYLPLIARQRFHCRGERRLCVIFQFKVGLNGWLGFSQSRRLTSCTPRVTTDKIERERTNRRSRATRGYQCRGCDART